MQLLHSHEIHLNINEFQPSLVQETKLCKTGKSRTSDQKTYNGVIFSGSHFSVGQQIVAEWVKALLSVNQSEYLLDYGSSKQLVRCNSQHALIQFWCQTGLWW